MRKDKSKVIDEQWDDARVKSFLAYRAHDGTPDDFHILLRAYQGMRAEDFARFLTFFAAEGRDLTGVRFDKAQATGAPVQRGWKGTWVGGR